MSTNSAKNSRAASIDRRKVLQMAGLMAGGAALGAAPQRSRVAAQDLEEAELRFYFGANPDEAKTRQKIIDAFQEKFPQIKIKPQVAEGDAVQELQIMFAGGDGPDIMMAWELNYSGLAERNIYADLQPYIDADEEYSKVVAEDHEPTLLKMFNYKEQQLVLPEQYAGVVLYYNTDMFEEAGVEPPPADWTDTSWTFDKFLETAKALTKGEGGRVSQFGFTDAWWPPLSSMVIGTCNGGNWFDQYVLPTESTIADPNIMEALQWYADLAYVHGVAPTAEQSQTQAGADLFMANRAAMALVGHWMYPAFSGVDGLNFDIGVFPVGPNGTTPKSDLGSTGLSMSASTKYPDHVWEFIKFSTGPEGQALIAESGLFVPVLKSVAASDAFLNAHADIQNVNVYTDAMANSVELPISPKWNEISVTWDREVTRVLQGKASAEEVLPPLQDEINKILGS